MIAPTIERTTEGNFNLFRWGRFGDVYEVNEFDLLRLFNELGRVLEELDYEREKYTGIS